MESVENEGGSLGEVPSDLPRRSMRKKSPSSKAKMPVLAQLQIELIAKISANVQFMLTIHNQLPERVNLDELDQILSEMEDALSEIKGLHGQISQKSGNEVPKEVVTQFQKYQKHRLFVIEAIEKRIDELQAEQEQDEQMSQEEAEKYVKEELLKLEDLWSSSTMSELNPSVPSRGIENTAPVSLPPTNAMDPASLLMAGAIAKSISQNMRASRMAEPPPDVFRGDKLKFENWLSNFDAYVEGKGLSNAEKMRHLQRYVGGEVENLIGSYCSIRNDDAYTKARARLMKRYGDLHQLADNYRQRLEDWPKIGPSEHMELRKFSDFLVQVSNAMESVPYLTVLNDYKENRKLKEKLPTWLATRWGREVYKIKKDKFKEPEFHDFVNFLEEEVEILHNPYNHVDVTPARQEAPKNARRSQTFRTKTSLGEKEYVHEEKCAFCLKKYHDIKNCFAFSKIPVEERWEFARLKRLCYNCLTAGHQSMHCLGDPCPSCKGRHANCLHKQAQPTREATHVSSKVTNHKADGLLSMIVPVHIRSRTGQREELVYAMLDTQSDASFITANAVKRLGTKGVMRSLTLTTLNQTKTTSTPMHNLIIRGYNSSEVLDLVAYEQDRIPHNRQQIPHNEHAARYKHLKILQEELPPFLNIPVSLLIGIDCATAFIPVETLVGKEPDEPFAIKTKLGWTLCGGSPLESANKRSNRVGIDHLMSALEPDFKDEESDVLLSQDDLKFVNILEKGIQCDDTGHTVMPLPFRERPSMPCNRQQVARRFEKLQKRFSFDAKYFADYKNFMGKMIANKEAELVQDVEVQGGEAWYLPHFGTYHPRKPDKIRVVFDCSAKYFGRSLNEFLLPGPDMMNGLSGILCRFRKEAVAISCDIKSMFHQFKVAEPDRNFLRFLWIDDYGATVDYRMTTHLFGATSSPGCATFGLRKLADSYTSQYPEASEFMKRNFYVDDGLTSVSNVDSAVKLLREVREICGTKSLYLHKFVSNQPDALKEVSEDEKDQAMKERDMGDGYALGLKWNILGDKFVFSSCATDKPFTRRGILSTVARIFDPLGFISPFVLKGKQILQETCRSSSDWDEPLEPGLRIQWEEWLECTKDMETIEIPRCLRSTTNPDCAIIRTELHYFSDASEIGYGACAYLRLVYQSGDVSCNLLMSKARVAPRKITTIPRLELQAAVLACELHLFLKSELMMAIDEAFFWTDSMIVLGYINSEAKRYKIFVANRIQRIRSCSNCDMWGYVSSEENPADMSSRGCSLQKLRESNWLTGPGFLNNSALKIERRPIPFQALTQIDCEFKPIRCLLLKSTNDLSSRFTKFSSWLALIRAMALLKSICARKSWSYAPVSVEALEMAKKFILQVVQKEHFLTELLALQRDGDIPKRSCVSKLCPVLKDGLLRVGGRVGASVMLTEDEKHPIIIPKECHVGKLIAEHYHVKYKHQGRSTTLGFIRQAGYWMISGTRTVFKILQDCVPCKKNLGSPASQHMGNLPPERLEPSPPFTHVGCDCFGPYTVKDRRSEIKRWALLVTCFYSRAVHLEVVDDLSTDSFLSALRRVIAVRGPISTIHCDRGTNFVGADNELEREASSSTGKLGKLIKENRCKFVFHPPTASHMGGVFERQIRTVKSVLTVVLTKYQTRIDTGTLRTILYEVMAIVNSRPISVENLSDPASSVITPNHLITGKRIEVDHSGAQLMTESSSEDQYGKKRWKHSQLAADEFWQQWKQMYLANLQVRQKWTKVQRNLTPGDVVIVDEADTPRPTWKLGIVETVTPGSDGLVRKVQVRTTPKGSERTTILERPVHKLVLLVPQDLK